MSMETHVFFRGKLPSKAALSRAMKELGFPYSIKPATGSLEQQSGFMPMLLRREETGVEFDVFGHDAVEEFADAGVDPSYERVANFRWGGDFQEAVAGMCSAAALTKLVNGVVFDEAENRLLSAEDAIAVARRNLETLVKPEATPRPGTRPADIKRYLKPLLKQRDDLVLIGRRLIIRPVQHLLRGAFLDRTSDKYQFQVWRYINPMFAGAQGVGYSDYVHPTIWKVWQPFFEPLLIDLLAEDVFDHVGPITTLSDLACELERTDVLLRFGHTRVVTLVLAGQRERAVQMVDAIERSNDGGHLRHWIKTQRTFLERDNDSICAEFHSREAETVKELKLGDIWQPGPFPVEVPEAERTTKCAEQPFAATPWPSRPPGLLEQPPSRPREVRFAKAALWRKGRVLMLVPLTSEQAEKKHRRHDYTLFARLADGIVLALGHRTGWNLDDPEQPRNPAYKPLVQFNLELHGSSHFARAWFGEDLDGGHFLDLRSIDVHTQDTRDSIWCCWYSPKDREKTIRDRTGRETIRMQTALTSEEQNSIVSPIPEFGEFDALLSRVRDLLRGGGFGDIVKLNALAPV